MLSLARIQWTVECLDALDEDSRELDLPSASDLRNGLNRASELSDNFRDPAVEAAALFFAFSEDDALTLDLRLRLPVTLAIEQLYESGFRLRRGHTAKLVDHCDLIAEGMSWDEFRIWFLELVIRPPK